MRLCAAPLRRDGRLQSQDGKPGRAAAFVGEILKGVKPGDIPIEQASKFELIANRKTARLIGVKFPTSSYSASTR